MIKMGTAAPTNSDMEVFNVSANNTHLSEVFYPMVKQPVYMVVVLSLAYGIIFVLAVMGNVCVVAIICRDKRFHSATYVFLVNLAVSDLLVALFCLPITLMTNLFNGWRFGAFMCKAVPYLQGVSVCASVNTLAAVALDRYLAICYVFKFKMTMRIARAILLFVWLIALFIMVPWAVYYTQMEFRTSLQLLYICGEQWPRFHQNREFFLGAIFLFCYAIPLSFIVVCYSLIGIKVWNRDAPGITTERGIIQKSKIRVVKMLAVVVFLFALSWLPLYTVTLKLYFFRPPDHSRTMKIIQDFIIPIAQWLGTSNSCMNPLVYCLFSKRIRQRIRLMLVCASSADRHRSLFSHYYSSTRHMTVDYSNGQVKLAFKRYQFPNNGDLCNNVSSSDTLQHHTENGSMSML